MNTLMNRIEIIFLVLFGLLLLFHLGFFLYRQYRFFKGIIGLYILKAFMKKEGILYVSTRHENFLKRKLKKADYFINFLEVVEESEEHKRENYLRNLKPVFTSLVSQYEKKNVGFQIYFVSFLSKYPSIYNDDWNSIIHYLIQCCSKSSVYLRENALKALYRVGNTTYLKETIRHMNYLKIPHPTRLLSEGFLSFEGDKLDLANTLKLEMSHYHENYKIACIEYFSRIQVDFRDYLLNVMISSEETMDVKIACMRYFAVVKEEKALPYLYEFLKYDEFFEYAAVCASVLKNYPSHKTFLALQSALSSKNWYVRNNAAASLVTFASAEELKLLKKIEDGYGKDAILYQIERMRKEKF